MAFKAPGYTQIPNEAFDDIFKTLKEGELRVLLVIMRQTFGWKKEWDRISLSQMERKTGMGRKAVNNALKSLIEKNIVFKHKEGNSGQEKCYYSLVVEEEVDANSNNSYQYPKDTPTSIPGIPPPSILRIPTKETKTSERKNNNKAAALSLEDQLKNTRIKDHIPRAMEYYRKNKSLVDSKDTLIGWLIFAIENDLDTVAPHKQKLIEKRMAWTREKEYTANAGYMKATDIGAEIGSGSTVKVYRYDKNYDDNFWNECDQEENR